MNDGKICVSVCARTAEELFEKAAQAETMADVIEARFDCLDSGAIERALSGVSVATPILFTYRPVSQGGGAPDDVLQRAAFWSSLTRNTDLGPGRTLIDNEPDLESVIRWPVETALIRSFHDFSGVPSDLDAIFDTLSSAGIAKIAVTANSITDGIAVWKLLERAASEGKQFIPVAMGEAGKWTRILAPAYGAFMTYASLDPDSKTAPGQISAADMLDVFRVKELGRDTEIYGIIAGDTSYSVSPWMHNAAFKSAGMDRVFLPLQASDLEAFFLRMVKPDTREIDLNFRGFSVTNPHKQTIVRYLDHVDETAEKIGAVNTVKIENGKFFGYNTDAPGFIKPLREAFGDLKNAHVGIAGAGGAARACIYALIKDGADVSVFARDASKAEPVASEFGARFAGSTMDAGEHGLDLIVNTTPLGTKGPEAESTIASADALRGAKLVYDLVYNPAETRLIREARSAGVPAIGGLEMLIAQGAEQFEIWTGEKAPLEAMAAAVRKKLGL